MSTNGHEVDFNGDYLRAREKMEQGRQWRGTAHVPIGDEQMTFAHRLLDEQELLRVQRAMPEGGEEEYDDEELQEAHERLLELQSKPNLTETEEEELRRLNEMVQDHMGDVEDELGDEAVDLLLEYGRKVIRPTDDDVEDLLNAPLEVQKQVFGGTIPQHLTHDKARQALIEDMREMVDGQPYPVKLNMGLQAVNETISVVGNGQ